MSKSEISKAKFNELIIETLDVMKSFEEHSTFKHMAEPEKLAPLQQAKEIKDFFYHKLHKNLLIYAGENNNRTIAENTKELSDMIANLVTDLESTSPGNEEITQEPEIISEINNNMSFEELVSTSLSQGPSEAGAEEESIRLSLWRDLEACIKDFDVEDAKVAGKIIIELLSLYPDWEEIYMLATGLWEKHKTGKCGKVLKNIRVNACEIKPHLCRKKKN